MNLQPKTLEKLRLLINEETEYRSGPKLIEFFKLLGFNDSYGQGFPSRWIYTDEKLKLINGTSNLDKCIKTLFSPVGFIGRFDDLDKFINDFNQYLSFDGWNVVLVGKEVSFKKVSEVKFKKKEVYPEDEFLNKDFEEISLEKLEIDSIVTSVLEQRLGEIKKCLKCNASLSVIFLCGSTLEGILLGIASNNPADFNKAKSAPKDNSTGKTRAFSEWSLSNFIDVAKEVGFIQEDVKKFSHVLREFRNYIHPYQQCSEKFNPSEHTAKLCWQTLKAAIFQISKNNE